MGLVTGHMGFAGKETRKTPCCSRFVAAIWAGQIQRSWVVRIRNMIDSSPVSVSCTYVYDPSIYVYSYSTGRNDNPNLPNEHRELAFRREPVSRSVSTRHRDRCRIHASHLHMRKYSPHLKIPIVMRIIAAAALLLLMLAAASNTSDSMQKERSEEETRRIFMQWTAEHGKTYSSLAEEERGYDMFKHRLRHIDRQWHEDGHSAWSWDMERSEEETRRIFVEWKAWNDKVYSSTSHEERRYSIFQDALRRVDRHNAGYAIGLHDSTEGINQFTDLTMEEYSVVCCGYRPEASPAELRWLAEVHERLRLVYAPSSM